MPNDYLPDCERKLSISWTKHLKNFVKALLTILCLSLVFISCQKIQERKIINGKWEVIKVELNHTDDNVMEIFLQDYVSNSTCCHYMVDFRDDNTCSSTYYRNDSLIYTVEGEWKMVDFNLVYVNLDQYVNAELDVDRHSKTYYTLSSETNKVAVFGGAETPTRLEIKKLD
jgi:hypothetical protein